MIRIGPIHNHVVLLRIGRYSRFKGRWGNPHLLLSGEAHPISFPLLVLLWGSRPEECRPEDAKNT